MKRGQERRKRKCVQKKKKRKKARKKERMKERKKERTKDLSQQTLFILKGVNKSTKTTFCCRWYTVSPPIPYLYPSFQLTQRKWPPQFPRFSLLSLCVAGRRFAYI